jgi:hypothetical protein
VLAHNPVVSVPARPAETPRWHSLTHELGDHTSPIREFFNDYFPRRNRVIVQRRYRDSAGPLLIPATPDVNSGTIGTAFDIWVQLQLTPRPLLNFAQVGGQFLSPRLSRSLTELLGTLAPQPTAPDGHVAWPYVAAPVPAEQLVRTAWVLALFVEVYRSGPSAGSPLSDISTPRWRRRPNLLDIPTAAQVTALRDITNLAEHAFLNRLWERHTTSVLAPEFPLSNRMNADADLLIDTTLYELKTNLGQRRQDGTRVCELALATLLQVLGYVLHDADDQHHIDTVGIYQARYGYLAKWPVDSLVAELAGHPLHLGDLRSEWSDLIQHGPDLPSP